MSGFRSMNAARKAVLFSSSSHPSLGRGFMGTPAKTQPRVSSSSRASPEERPICSFGRLDPEPVRNHCEATRPFWSLSAPHRRRIQPRVIIWHYLHRWNGRAARNRQLGASWSRTERLGLQHSVSRQARVNPRGASAGGVAALPPHTAARQKRAAARLSLARGRPARRTAAAKPKLPPASQRRAAGSGAARRRRRGRRGSRRSDSRRMPPPWPPAVGGETAAADTYGREGQYTPRDNKTKRERRKR